MSLNQDPKNQHRQHSDRADCCLRAIQTPLNGTFEFVQYTGNVETRMREG